jgi:hypothetical protein
MFRITQATCQVTDGQLNNEDKGNQRQDDADDQQGKGQQETRNHDREGDQTGGREPANSPPPSTRGSGINRMGLRFQDQALTGIRSLCSAIDEGFGRHGQSP